MKNQTKRSKSMKANTKSVVSSFELDCNLAEIEIKYKKKVKYKDMEKITTSGDAFNVLRKIWSDKLEHIEESYLLCLNRANKVLGYVKLSSGGICGTVVDIKVILQVAIKSNSSALILSHNHRMPLLLSV
jgi:DNA repair protein RadC